MEGTKKGVMLLSTIFISSLACFDAVSASSGKCYYPVEYLIVLSRQNDMTHICLHNCKDLVHISFTIEGLKNVHVIPCRTNCKCSLKYFRPQF